MSGCELPQKLAGSAAELRSCLSHLHGSCRGAHLLTCLLPCRSSAAAGIVCGFIGQGLANSMMLLKRKCVRGGTDGGLVGFAHLRLPCSRQLLAQVQAHSSC